MQSHLLQGFSYPDQPTFVLEFSAEGSYAPGKFDTRRYNGLYACSLGVFLNPTNPDKGKVMLTYQNGYSRDAPTKPLTGLVLTLATKF